jgi:hypothetical protein
MGGVKMGGQSGFMEWKSGEGLNGENLANTTFNVVQDTLSKSVR